MKNINILDSNTIDKIAAGEVVERPSAVVKELVENSIDANADAVTIEIKDGGISFIRITDNGEGIDRSQVKKAFMRHATSKIKSVEDLISVTSLGFRGEALSSISAVGKVEFLTKTKTDFIGTRYVVEGGRECVFEDAGIPDGTTIIVRDLFFNVPARKKFLKSPSSEGNNITELIEHMILSHPNISFKYIYNGNVKLQSSGKNDIKSCIYNVYGRDIANGLIEVKSIRDDISIHGFIGKPELARATRNFEIYFVNNRFIKSTLIDRALEEAYKDYLMLHKYPTVFLYFEIPSHLIDVNVHPTKREIRFFEGEALKCYIVDVIKNALINKELIKEIVEEHHEKPSVKESEINKEPFETINHIIESSYNNYYSSEIEKEDESTDINDKNEQLTLFDDKFISEESIKKHRTIGQLFNTYWLIEFENKLFIVDQHAAHEKVNYERLIKKLRNNENCSQNIYPPIVVSLSNAEAQYVTKYNENFLNVGFTIEHFGGLDYTISTVPMELLSQNPADYFHEMLDELMEKQKVLIEEKGKNSKETETVNLKIATMACKASVKGNMHLSVFEADKLISELLTLENPYNCPHGRPTIISFSKYEIEKMFKRIVN